MKRLIGVFLSLVFAMGLVFSGTGCTSAVNPFFSIEESNEDVLESEQDSETDADDEGRGGKESEGSDKPTQSYESEESDKPTKSDDSEEVDKPTKDTDDVTKESDEKPTKKPEDSSEATTEKPIVKPTEAPTVKPTEAPTVKPTQAPTEAPTTKPTQAPTTAPTEAPTEAPTTAPTTAWQPGSNNYDYSELQSFSNITTANINYAREILSTIITNDMTDVQRIKEVHDFLVKNTTYDNDYYNKSDSHDHLENILVEKRAVCQGYAVAFYVFMKELGIPCSILSGEANNGYGMEDHAWNAVKIDGSWYFVDVTWNDPIMTESGHNTYPDGYNMSYEFLLCTFDYIGVTHTYDGYVGEQPTPYGVSNKYNDEMHMATGIDGIYRISSIDTVSQVAAGVNDSCTYVFIIEGGGITVDDVVNAFVEELDGRIAGGLSYYYSNVSITISFTKS